MQCKTKAFRVSQIEWHPGKQLFRQEWASRLCSPREGKSEALGETRLRSTAAYQDENTKMLGERATRETKLDTVDNDFPYLSVSKEIPKSEVYKWNWVRQKREQSSSFDDSTRENRNKHEHTMHYVSHGC